jgi:Cys-rich repeat protein
MSGIICSGPNGICTPGCGTAPHNDCPTGMMCGNIVNGTGTCSTSGGGGCTLDSDCHNPLPRCNVTTSPGTCVQCLADADCPASFVCDPTKNVCTECTPTKTAACDPNLAGSQCLTSGQCGCTDDTDCGDPTSGRVCDTSIGRCGPGCRGMGGNGCPVSQVCSSTTTAIGGCEPPPSSDGGADGGGGTHGDGGGTDGAGARDGSTGDGASGAGADGGGRGGGSGNGGATGNGGVGAMDGGLTGGGGAGARSGAGGRDGMNTDGGENPDAALIHVNGYIAGGGCRCDAAGPGAFESLLPILGLLALVTRRRRPRRNP